MAVPISKSYVESTVRIQPNQANNYDNTHGGEVVRMMDELAAISAMRVARETCVTASIGGVDFRVPIPVGHVAELAAFAHDTGRTSIEVSVEVDARDPREDAVERTTSARFTMVAVDEDGSPVAVPDVVAESERCRELRDSALDADQPK
jgi:acyl-CoA hydrolase